MIVATKETGLEVNVDKTKYMVMSREQNGGRSDSMRIDKRSFGRVEESKYLGTNLKNQNSIQGEIKSRNACCHWVQELMSSNLLPKNLKIKIYRTIILPIVVYGFKTWSLILREKRRQTEGV